MQQNGGDKHCISTHFNAELPYARTKYILKSDRCKYLKIIYIEDNFLIKIAH